MQSIVLIMNMVGWSLHGLLVSHDFSHGHGSEQCVGGLTKHLFFFYGLFGQCDLNFNIWRYMK